MRRGRPRYLGDSVYGALRQAIIDRTFDPGEPLDHLVRVVPKKGAFVRSLSHDEIRDLYQVREELEALAVRLAGAHLQSGELEPLEARFRELDARGGAAGHAEVRALGDEFHRYLVKRADNTKLLQVLEQMREEVQPVWTMSSTSRSSTPSSGPTCGAPSGSWDGTSGVFATPSSGWSTEAATDRGGRYG